MRGSRIGIWLCVRIVKCGYPCFLPCQLRGLSCLSSSRYVRDAYRIMVHKSRSKAWILDWGVVVCPQCQVWSSLLAMVVVPLRLLPLMVQYKNSARALDYLRVQVQSWLALRFSSSSLTVDLHCPSGANDSTTMTRKGSWIRGNNRTGKRLIRELVVERWGMTGQAVSKHQMIENQDGLLFPVVAVFNFVCLVYLMLRTRCC